MAAGVPIVFAINKIDKPGANPDKIKEELAGMNYLVEEWGGKYQSQDISAKKGLGILELLEKVLLEAEMLDLKANPDRKATGSIIESSLDKGRGYVATMLVSNGTLHAMDQVKFLSTQITEVFVGKNAMFDLYELESTHTNVVRINNMFVKQASNSRVHLNGMTLHNGVTRNSTHGWT